MYGLLTLACCCGLKAQEFHAGADLSFLPQVEADGGVYLDLQGNPAAALDVFASAGIDTVRLRLWVNPADGNNDLAAVLALAQRAAAAGMGIFLDIHYSDTWADPGRQDKPAAWASLGFDELTVQVQTYTQAVVAALVAQGTVPVMVQTGNEITAGLLWPDGMLSPNSDSNWPAFSTLIAAATRGVRDATPGGMHIDVALHIDNGADNDLARWFFDRATDATLDFDVIAVSFYPWWHGSIDELRSNLVDLSQRYQKDIVVAETAYPWTLDFADNTNNLVGLPGQVQPGFPATPEGQRAFVAEVTGIVDGLTRGRGVFYWAPDWISTSAGSAWENVALFDFDANPLPAMQALKPVMPPPVTSPQPPPATSSGGGGAVTWLLALAVVILRCRDGISRCGTDAGVS